MSADRVSYESLDRGKKSQENHGTNAKESKIVLHQPTDQAAQNETIKIPRGSFDKGDDGSERGDSPLQRSDQQ